MFASLSSLLKGPEEKIEEICRESGDERALNRVLVRNPSINVNLLKFQGLSPLHLASLSGHVKVCELLIFGGAHANPSLKTDQNGAMPIHLAAWHGATEVLVVLVERAGVAVDDQSSDGFSALHYACWGGQVSAAKYLLKRGASVVLKNNDGYTPLLLASRCGKIDIVELLLDTTASVVDEGDNQGCTSLHHACWDGHREVVRRLLVAGASVVKADLLGRRPVDLCKTRDIKELVQSVGLKMRRRGRGGGDAGSGGAEAAPVAGGGSGSTPRHLPHTLSSLSSVQAALSSLSSVTSASVESPGATSSSGGAAGASPGTPAAGGMLRSGNVPPVPVASSSVMARPRVRAFLRMLSGSKDTGDAAVDPPSAEGTNTASSAPAPDAPAQPASPAGTPKGQRQGSLQAPRSASPPAAPASPHFHTFLPTPTVQWRDADHETESENGEVAGPHTPVAAHGIVIPPSVIQECWAICAGSGNAKSLYRLLRAYPVLGDAHEGCPISNLRDADGLTPLMRAAQRGFPDVVKLLLIVGCSVSAVDTHGCNALHHASTHGRDACLSLLLPAATGRGKSSNGSSEGSSSSSNPALALVPNSPRSLAFAQTMSSPSAAPAEVPGITTTLTATATTASASSSSSSSPSAAEAPLSLDAPNVNKETALHRAAAHGHLQCVVMLVAAGASVGVADKLGWTAMHHACYRNHTRTVTYLMSRDPQAPLAITRSAETPADLAADTSIKRCLKAQIWYNMVPAVQFEQKRAAEKELRRVVTAANNEAGEGSEWDDDAEKGREAGRPNVVWSDESAAAIKPAVVQRRPPAPESKQQRTPDPAARAATADVPTPEPVPAVASTPAVTPGPGKKWALLKILARLPGTVGNAPTTRAASPKATPGPSSSSSSSSATGAGTKSAGRPASALRNVDSRDNETGEGRGKPPLPSSSSSPVPVRRVELTPATAHVDANDVLLALKQRGQKKTAPAGLQGGSAPARDDGLPAAVSGAPVADAPAGEAAATRSGADLISSLRDRLLMKRPPPPGDADAPPTAAEAAAAALALTPLQAKLQVLREEQRAEQALARDDMENDETTSGSLTTAHDTLPSPSTSPNARSRAHKALALLSRHGGAEAGLIVGGKATEHDVFLFSLVLTQVFSAYSNSVSRSFYRWKHRPLTATPGSGRKDAKRAQGRETTGDVDKAPRVFTFENF